MRAEELAGEEELRDRVVDAERVRPARRRESNERQRASAPERQRVAGSADGERAEMAAAREAARLGERWPRTMYLKSRGAVEASLAPKAAAKASSGTLIKAVSDSPLMSRQLSELPRSSEYSISSFSLCHGTME